jgi:hypothetical protein
MRTQRAGTPPQAAAVAAWGSGPMRHSFWDAQRFAHLLAGSWIGHFVGVFIPGFQEVCTQHLVFGARALA